MRHIRMASCEIEPFVAGIPKEDLMMTNGENPLQDLSNALADAAAQAGAYTVVGESPGGVCRPAASPLRLIWF